MGRKIIRRRVIRAMSDGTTRVREEKLAGEEPLEIRFGHTSFTTSMRTPGDDFDLVAGFLLAEGIVTKAEHLAAMRYCLGTDEDGNQTYNVIEVQLGFGAVPPDLSAARNVVTSSACGICGTNSIDEVRKKSTFELREDCGQVELGVLLSMPDTLRESQKLFSSTGGVHAAGLFSTGGELLILREDVGRHNAVDKVIGAALREGRMPLSDTVLQVSGRASFELVQKAAMAGIPVLTAVSAPSSLAVDLAQDAGLTLAAFSRGHSVNLYTHAHRVVNA
ncbi:formate dehydrogenase accessory sulfurtransferase FdhD [Glutamicibacter protophormiae]|uniref:formate dehydrogenase accessory sulfurtransferase FdhD n=1 Tax=Glutamicibacter protophormiae TaxID=37930 RepID=UPI002A8076E8|nr:formate dehydrogenase accessory sulfurtransferase FdhD [Glutamicibacter protophormiae]WPR64220.1 formate dehydrogenase accessory sulfurtransferase FdhD [Glutamicibacter protophormiae]WPR67713.1 formate dehydrogenase accessory sulfurtransferase FdhD [Glutamicibacter protophormiae]